MSVRAGQLLPSSQKTFGLGRSALAVVVLLAARAWTLAAEGTATNAAEDLLRADAQLTDVFFIDEQHGWIVGDRGTILHTVDGGAHWQPQNSGVECRLTSAWFLDRQRGWAAGGSRTPYAEASTAVLLRTDDGGEHWQRDRNMLLPAMRKIKFFDAARGCAIAESSPLFSSSIFVTENGGRHWSPLPAAGEQCWLTGDFLDPTTGAVAGRRGATAAMHRSKLSVGETDFGIRALRHLAFQGPAQGWLVGDGGLVLRSEDQGRSWQTPAGLLPEGTSQHFDFAAVNGRGSHVWVAGQPGSRIFHSPDGGQTWTAQPTKQHAPIRDLAFVDEQHGWAVGDLGLILATEDGGQTWQRRQGHATRAALLAIYSQPEEIPLEMVGRLCGEEGYLGVVSVLNRRDLEQGAADLREEADRVHAAVVAAGGTVGQLAWRFPVRQGSLRLTEAQLVDAWDQANDGHGLERLRAHLVEQIRTWRPSVVFTSGADARHPVVHERLVNQFVLIAVEQAADATRYPEQLSQTGLAPWRVDKVYATLPAGVSGSANINSADVSERQGSAIADVATAARGLLSCEYTPVPANLGFRLLINRLPRELGERDFFSGILLQPGGDARRMLFDTSGLNVAALRRNAQMRRNVQAILAQADARDPSDGRWLAQLGEQSRALDANSAAHVLFQLAQRYERQGRWELAAECHDMIATRYPKHALAGRSLSWLVQYFASGEAAWRLAQDQQVQSQHVITHNLPGTQADAAAGGVQPAAATALTGSASPVQQNVRQAGLFQNMRSGPDDRLSRASGYAKQLEQHAPAVAAEPTARFPLAAAQRRNGFTRPAEQYCMSVTHARPHDAWWSCAQAELWLAQPQGECPKTVWSCRHAASKPRLDGKLDEPLWREAQRVALVSPQHDDAQWPTAALMSYDQEFLYIGVSCRRAAPRITSPSAVPRPRDGDLQHEDRVVLHLDIDRDYATFYTLAVDQRGWTNDVCWRDVSWNPEWYVAAGSDEETWTAECAIPLRYLTGDSALVKQVWAVGIERIVPSVGFQAWSQPASPDVLPEGFGYLIFE